MAMDLAEECYRLTSHFPRTEMYGISAQIRRAAVSIPSNIAEGHNRRSRGAFAHHLSIALGSQAEVETQLELAGRLGLAVPEGIAETLALAESVGRSLHRLLDAIERLRRGEQRSRQGTGPKS
jgi:four helix bundle protein